MFNYPDSIWQDLYQSTRDTPLHHTITTDNPSETAALLVASGIEPHSYRYTLNG